MLKPKYSYQQHLNTIKHSKRLRAWNDNQRQAQLHAFRNVGELQETYFNGFMFSSILCNLTGRGAARFNSMFLKGIVKMKYSQRMPETATAYSRCVGAARRTLNVWIKQAIDSYSPQSIVYNSIR